MKSNEIYISEIAENVTQQGNLQQKHREGSGNCRMKGASSYGRVGRLVQKVTEIPCLSFAFL